MTAGSGRRLFGYLPKSKRLGDCLKTLLESTTWGSMISLLTWRVAATKRGYVRFRLVPSAPNKSAAEYMYWPTARQRDWKGRSPKGRCNPSDSLPSALMAYWQTATATEATGGRTNRSGDRKDEVASLQAGLRRYWAGPKASLSGPDFARRNRPGTGGDDLTTQLAEFIGTDAKSGMGQSTTAPCPIAFRAWLMGYPPEYVTNWLLPLETQSTGQSRRKSCGR